MISLKKLAKEGISPSALTNYLHNPIAFYKQKVLGIKEIKDVEETIAYNTLGTVVHETLDELYTPLVGRYLSLDDIAVMQNKIKILVTKHFKIWFKNGDLKTGKNRLIFEVAVRFVENFLKQEKELLKNDGNQLKIIATEEDIETTITVEGINFPIKIHGKVDRVDELNGVTRIIDYKTGMVDQGNLKANDFTKFREDKYHKAVQVLLYAFLYIKDKNYDFNNPLEAGIISFKNLKKGFLAINFSKIRSKNDQVITEERLEEFMAEIKNILLEIYNIEIPFIEPTDLKY